MSRNPMPPGRHDEALAAAGWRCTFDQYEHPGPTPRCVLGPLVVHHRKPKGMGGTADPSIHDLDNLAVLCDQHHRWVHAHAADSYDNGLLIRR